MLLKTKKGYYQVLKNYKDAFDLQMFEDRYIEECFDQYPYIVGDISSDILRLKGFSSDPKSKKYYKLIDEYIEKSCAFRCPCYVLKRITSDKEYEELLKNDKPLNDVVPEVVHIEKVAYDKENLVLESSAKTKPNIVLDMEKINSIPKGELSSDLKQAIKEDSQPTPAVTATYVSASPNFNPDAVKKNFNGQKNNKGGNKQNQKPNTNNGNNNNNQANKDSKNFQNRQNRHKQNNNNKPNQNNKANNDNKKN